MMLKIHKTTSKSKLLTRSIIASICIVSGLLGLSLLTYTPELSHAESVVYPEPKSDLSTITYMQDITPEICTNTHEADANSNYQYQLIDKRDGKTYWVAKLKDGNCWMTQNLDLDLWDESKNIGIILTPTDSNVMTNWTSNSGPSVLWKGNYDYTIESYNAVMYYDPGFKFCKGSTYNCDSNTSYNNGHDAQGNYYSWGAATAGQSMLLTDDTAGQLATQSICPNGWRLPLNGSAYDNQNGSLSKMLLQYGIITNSSLVPNADLLWGSPLYFVATSMVHPSGNLGEAGYRVAYYSSAVANGRSGLFGASIYRAVNIQNIERRTGIPIRCLALGEEEAIKNNDNIEVVVNPMLTLDVTNEVEVKKSDNNPSTANLDVKVTSNQGYSIQINAKDHAELTSSTTDVKIPSASGTLNGNTNAWGIKKPGEDTYTEVTTTAKVFYQSTVAEIKTIPFIIGVSTASDIPNGEYSTDITITAIQN